MVKTTTDVMDIHPLERMDKLAQISAEKKSTIASKKKELEELEKKKKEEIANLEKKKLQEIENLEKTKKKELEELENKKKELEDLQKKKLKEIDETETLIERSFQDLMKHKRMLIAEEEEKQKDKQLESIVAPEDKNLMKSSAPVAAGGDYTRFFDTLKNPHDVYSHVPHDVYEATNYNFYNSLTNLRDKAVRGDISPEEEKFLDIVKSQFERFSEHEGYSRADEHNYIQRSLNVLGQIANYQGSRQNRTIL